MHGEHASEALHGIEAGEVRRDGLGGEDPAAEEEGCQQGGRDDEQEERRHQGHGFQPQGRKGCGQQVVVEGGLAAEGKSMDQYVLGAAAHPGAGGPQSTDAGQHDHEGGQFPRMGNLPFLPGLFQAPG